MIGLKVKNGVVTDAAVFDEIPEGWHEAKDGAGIGWTRNTGGKFSPPVPAPVPEPTIPEQIEALERTVTPRRLREAILTPGGKVWLQNKEDDIAALRAANPPVTP